MLRKLLPTMSDAEFAEVLDLTTLDVLVNRVGYNERTSLRDVVRVAGICLGIVRRPNEQKIS